MNENVLKNHKCKYTRTHGVSLEGSGPGGIWSAWDEDAKREQSRTRLGAGSQPCPRGELYAGAYVPLTSGVNVPLFTNGVA